MSKPLIFEYEDYRLFLKDTYEYLKSQNVGFSFRVFAREAELSSPNYLKLVMDGKRSLSLRSVPKFSRGLKLNQQESEFFENLVGFNQAKNVSEKNRFFERMQRSKRYKQIREIELDQYEYFSRWYYAAIREMTALSGSCDDPQWIAEHLNPKVTVAQATEAIELLLRLGFLRRNQSGKLVQAESNIASAPQIKSVALINFHRQMLEKASESLEKFSSDDRDISSVTVAVPVENLPRLKKDILNFRRRLLAAYESLAASSDRVFQLSIALFPLTEKIPPKGN